MTQCFDLYHACTLALEHHPLLISQARAVPLVGDRNAEYHFFVESHTGVPGDNLHVATWRVMQGVFELLPETPLYQTGPLGSEIVPIRDTLDAIAIEWLASATLSCARKQAEEMSIQVGGRVLVVLVQYSLGPFALLPWNASHPDPQLPAFRHFKPVDVYDNGHHVGLS